MFSKVTPIKTVDAT